MKEDVLDVLMYLFENYIDNVGVMESDQEALKVELLQAGFAKAEIGKAFKWLVSLNAQRKEVTVALPAAHSLRIYTDEEINKLDVECRGFLLFLEQVAVLDAAGRELVIDGVMALDTEEIDLDQLKWVILMVLFNQPGQEAAYNWMEELLLDAVMGYVH